MVLHGVRFRALFPFFYFTVSISPYASAWSPVSCPIFFFYFTVSYIFYLLNLSITLIILNPTNYFFKHASYPPKQYTTILNKNSLSKTSITIYLNMQCITTYTVKFNSTHDNCSVHTSKTNNYSSHQYIIILHNPLIHNSHSNARGMLLLYEINNNNKQPFPLLIDVVTTSKYAHVLQREKLLNI